MTFYIDGVLVKTEPSALGGWWALLADGKWHHFALILVEAVEDHTLSFESKESK
jgi:hypothetical protein